MKYSVSESVEWKRLPPNTKILIEDIQKQLPVKLGLIAQALGAHVLLSTLAIGISGQIAVEDGRPTIRINRHDIKRRQRFTLAHEISHFLLHRDLLDQGIVDNILYRSKLSSSTEAQANRLGADILMPRHRIVEAVEQNPALPDSEIVAFLCNIFDVSEEAMAIRLGLA